MATPTSLPVFVGSAHRAFAADRGEVVPVVLGDELVRISEMKGDCTHTVCSAAGGLSAVVAGGHVE
jgi:hypothetical protein